MVARLRGRGALPPYPVEVVTMTPREPIVLWRSVWHLTDRLGRYESPPMLTLCGRDVPSNAAVRERSTHPEWDHLCTRCREREATQ